MSPVVPSSFSYASVAGERFPTTRLRVPCICCTAGTCSCIRSELHMYLSVKHKLLPGAGRARPAVPARCLLAYVWTCMCILIVQDGRFASTRVDCWQLFDCRLVSARFVYLSAVCVWRIAHPMYRTIQCSASICFDRCRTALLDDCGVCAFVSQIGCSCSRAGSDWGGLCSVLDW